MAGKILRDDVFEYQKIVDGLTVVTGKLDELGKSIVEIKKAGGTFSFDKLVSSNKKIEQSQSSLKKIEEERIRIQKEIEKVFIKNLAAEEKNYKVLIKGREALKQKNAALREEITGQKAAAKARREAAAAEKQQAAMAKLLIAARNTESGSLSRLNALNNIYKARMKELNVLIPAQAKTYDFLNKKILMNQKAMANMAMGAQRGTKQFNMLQWQIMQVSREMPAFAYGINVGIGALSNNLSMLFDEIGKVRKANAALIKQGKPVTSVFKQIATSILSWQTALVVGVTLITLYGDEIAQWITKVVKGKAALDDIYNSQKKLIELQKSVVEGTQDERYELTILHKATQDANLSKEEQISAAEKLRDLYPDTLSNYTNEAILAGEAADAIKTLTDNLVAKAKADAILKVIGEDNIKILELKRKKQALQAKETGELGNRWSQFWTTQGNAIRETFGTTSQDVQDEIDAIKQRIKDLGGEFDISSYLFDPKKTEKNVKGSNKITKDEYERFLPTMEEAYKAHYIALESAARGNAESLNRIKKIQLENELEQHKIYGNLTLSEVAEINARLLELDDEYYNMRRDSQVAAIYEQANIERVEVAKQYQEEFQNSKKRQRDKIAATGKTAIRTLQIEYDAAMEVQALYDENTEEWKRQEERKLQLEEQLASRSIDINKKMEDQKLKDFKQAVDQTTALMNASFDLNAALNDRALANAERRYELERAAAGENLFKQAVAEQRFADEKAKLEHRQAVADKANAAFNVILQTSKWIAEYGFFTPQAILASILGGIQLATVLAEPIPTYAEGVEGHPGGLAIVGDKKGNPSAAGGSELGILPSGDMFLTPNSPTLMDLPKGTDIIPHDETTRMLATQAMSRSHDIIDMSNTNSHLRRIEKNTGESVHYEGGYKIVRRNGFIGRYR